MNALRYELKVAGRGLLAQPMFSALVVGVLGAGMACVIYMLIAIGSMVLRPLPFPEPQRLHYVGAEDGGGGRLAPLRADDLLGLRRQLDGRAEVAGITKATINLSDLDRPERHAGAFVSGNLLRTLGAVPALGRDFDEADERAGAAPVVMLSDATWRIRYGADPAIVGRAVRVNAKMATVIGVMPPDFSYPERETVWMAATLAEGASDEHDYTVVVRRHAGTSQPALDAAVDAWFADASRREAGHFRGIRIGVQPLAWLTINRSTRAVLDIMFAAVALVLLVACANVANLLLTRTLARRQELAVRVALGASRGRLMAHLLAQSLLLTLVATAIALPLAMAAADWTERAFRVSTDGPPLWIHFTLDARSAALAIAVAFTTALAAGVLPALRAGGEAMAQDLRDGSRSVAGGAFARISRALVVGEIALSCALLIAVGTLVRGIVAIDRADLGFDPTGMLTARIGLFENAHPTGADRVRLYERIAERLRADSAVIDATAATNLPALGGQRRDVLPEGEVADGGALPRTLFSAVDDRFFATYRLRLLEGRSFDSRDGAEAAQVAIVDRRFADRHASGGPVLGKRFRLDPHRADAPMVTVVGVVDAVQLDEPGSTAQPVMFVPLRQQPARFVSFAVRVDGDPAAFAPRLADVVREIDADTPAYWVNTYAQAIRGASFSERLLARMFGVFGAIALVLAGAGLYGVLAFNVGQRTREIGVRRALGAPSTSVVRDLATRTVWQLGIGLVLGLVVGIPFARLLAGTLDKLAGVDTGVIVAALLAISAAAVFALVVPARRALRVDPMVALRHE